MKNISNSIPSESLLLVFVAFLRYFQFVCTLTFLILLPALGYCCFVRRLPAAVVVDEVEIFVPPTLLKLFSAICLSHLQHLRRLVRLSLVAATIQNYCYVSINSTLQSMWYHNVSSSNYIKVSSPVPIRSKALDMFGQRHPSLPHLWIMSVLRMILRKNIDTLRKAHAERKTIHSAFDSLQKMKEKVPLPCPVGL